eukprot:436173-Rhodomonas_salina.1
MSPPSSPYSTASYHHTLRQYQLPRTTIPHASTNCLVPPYPTTVVRTAYRARRPLGSIRRVG